MPVDGRTVSRATVAAADALGAAVLAGVSAVSDSVGLGRLVAADDGRRGSTPRPAAGDGPGRRRGRRFASLPAEPLSARACRELPPRDRRGLRSAGRARRALPDAPRDGHRRRTPSADAPIDSAIYTPGADGVSPPVGVRPQLPRQLPPTVDPGNLSRIELIIARDGSVESARLLGNRRRRPGRDVPERGESVAVPAGDEGRGCRPLSQDDPGVL